MPPSSDGRPDLPSDAELLRYVSGGLIQDGIVDGAAFKVVDGAAFKPRAGDSGELSVNQLGVFDQDEQKDIAEIRRVRSQWMTIRKSGRFAQIAVSSLEECAAEAAQTFNYWADPVIAKDEGRDGCEDDPSHAVIAGLPEGDEDSAIALRDMIAMRVSKLHQAV